MTCWVIIEDVPEEVQVQFVMECFLKCRFVTISTRQSVLTTDIKRVRCMLVGFLDHTKAVAEIHENVAVFFDRLQDLQLATSPKIPTKCSCNRHVFQTKRQADLFGKTPVQSIVVNIDTSSPQPIPLPVGAGGSGPCLSGENGRTSTRQTSVPSGVGPGLSRMPSTLEPSMGAEKVEGNAGAAPRLLPAMTGEPADGAEPGVGGVQVPLQSSIHGMQVPVQSTMHEMQVPPRPSVFSMLLSTTCGVPPLHQPNGSGMHSPHPSTMGGMYVPQQASVGGMHNPPPPTMDRTYISQQSHLEGMYTPQQYMNGMSVPPPLHMGRMYSPRPAVVGGPPNTLETHLGGLQLGQHLAMGGLPNLAGTEIGIGMPAPYPPVFSSAGQGAVSHYDASIAHETAMSRESQKRQQTVAPPIGVHFPIDFGMQASGSGQSGAAHFYACSSVPHHSQDGDARSKMQPLAGDGFSDKFRWPQADPLLIQIPPYSEDQLPKQLRGLVVPGGGRLLVSMPPPAVHPTPESKPPASFTMPYFNTDAQTPAYMSPSTGVNPYLYMSYVDSIPQITVPLGAN